MSLIYPVANDARAALTGPQGEARTKAEAREIAGGEVTLETDWLKPDPDEADDLSGAVSSPFLTERRRFMSPMMVSPWSR